VKKNKVIEKEISTFSYSTIAPKPHPFKIPKKKKKLDLIYES
jgi:hypothetical protein